MMIHYKQKHLGMHVLLLSLHQLQGCFIWLICSSKKLFTATSSEEEEQFNCSTENMEVSFQAYQMDYDAFMDLHELLKPGLNEYIRSNNN